MNRKKETNQLHQRKEMKPEEKRLWQKKTGQKLLVDNTFSLKTTDTNQQFELS
jgi:hypothetical protein